MDTYRTLLRPVLFRMDPETAHSLGKTALRRTRPWSMLGPGDAVSDPRLQVELGGIQLANPVGIAAGFDKDSEMLGAFAALGFGYVIPGSVRPRPAGDLPSPKLVRYPDRESMINSQGMPSKGARYVAGRLRAYRQHERRTRIIANITGWTVEEYVEALEALQAGADGIELSLSCPNETYDETVDFLAPAKFTGLIERLNERRRIPLFVKIRNYNNSEERDNRFELIELCLKLGVDGVTLPGSHIVDEPRLAARRGNLSGKAVFPKTVDNVRDVYKMSGGRIAIKALGGVFTGKDAFDAISAGASSVELLTGLVYEGWSIAQKINRSLLELLQASGIPDVQALRGTAVGSAADDATRSGVAAAVATPRAG